MAERDDDDVNGAAGASDAGSREGLVFTEEQRRAIADLASENTYAKQSKWRTFRELPMKDKWPFFAQHFLLGVVAVIVAIALVVMFVVENLTRGPDPLLYIAGVNVPSDISEPMERLDEGFAASSGLDGELVTYDGAFTITASGYNGGTYDSSARLLTMASAGTLNAIITDEETFAQLSAAGMVSPLADVLTDAQLSELDEAGVTVEADSSDAQGTGMTDKGLDLSRSQAWASVDGLPDGMILGFSNVSETGVEYPQAFVDYLDFS